MDDQPLQIVQSKTPRFSDLSAFLGWLDDTTFDHDTPAEEDLKWGDPVGDDTEGMSLNPAGCDTEGMSLIEPLDIRKISDHDEYGWGKKLCPNCLYLVIQSQFLVDSRFSSRVLDLREFDRCIVCLLVKSLATCRNGGGFLIHPRFGDPQLQNGFWYSQINVLWSTGSLGLIGTCRKFPEAESVLADGHYGFPQRWLRDQLNDCDINHPQCHQIKDPKVDLYLIDALQHCLVPASSNWRYLALSYVWGGVDQLKTTKSNISSLFKIGSLQNYGQQIPRLIKDAIELVNSIGERFLWVDSLCIVQDDDTERHRQICQMGSIYGNAYLTIVAISAISAQSSLPGVGYSARHCGYTSVTDDLKVFATRNSLSDALLHSTYDTRGWTYQERILSRRCVYMSDWELFFCCDRGVRREFQALIYHQPNFYDSHPGAPSKYVENPLHLLQHYSEYDIPLHLAFSAFSEMAESHSRKNLLYQKDRLFAFAGILARLASLLGCPSIRDVPKHILQYGLLWMPCATYQPEISITSHSQKFPTWSWTAWDAEIDYKFARHLMQFDYLGYRPISFNHTIEMIEPDRPLTATLDTDEVATLQQSLLERDYSQALLIKTGTIELSSLERLPDQDWTSRFFDGQKIYLLADANDLAQVALFGCICQPGEKQGYELVEIGRMESPSYFAPPPVILENGFVASTISFMEDLLGRQELVIVLFTERASSFSRRLGFGFVAYGAWESCLTKHTTVCLI